MRDHRITRVLSAMALWFTACATGGDEDSARTPGDRGLALDALDALDGLDGLRHAAGAPVTLEVNDAGTSRVVTMSPSFTVASQEVDPAAAAQRFLAEHHDVFQLSADEVSRFVVTRVDVEPKSGLRHVTLQRAYNGIPVFQGVITVHMDPGNGVFRVLGDELSRFSAPSNQQVLTPAEAAFAAGKALQLPELAPVLTSSEGLRTTFTAARAQGSIDVEPRIFPVADGDHRFAYQAMVSWLDEHQQRYEQVVVDAQDGAPLFQRSLVSAFSGLVFTASPGANPVFDTRVLASFNGNPSASPIGWVAVDKTQGNNTTATSGTLLSTANSSGVFSFPFDPLQAVTMFKEAAVTNAFYLINDFHDRTYALGFTESAGNFQSNNFGKGGAGSDDVQVDVRANINSSITTPSDGTKPRLSLDMKGAFDPSMVYHEITHGLLFRILGGGGSTTCFSGLQSAGMNEGYSDFMAASFLGDPVIGAYVSGNGMVGIRHASMAGSPFTYANIQNGTMTGSHDAGEVWAAALWAVRNALGAAVTQQLVVTGLKLTPCNPTMLQARDGMITADMIINGGANRCALFAAFASRLMGSGASSPNVNSTSAIVTSSSVPANCRG